MYSLYGQHKHGVGGRTWLQVGLILLQHCTWSSSHALDEFTDPKCGIYLAPSTIPMAGLGVFAGDTYYAKDDVVTKGDLVLSVVDYYWNNQGGPYEDDFFLWDEYSWHSSMFPGMEEESHGTDSISGISPGVGALPNHYATMSNIYYEETVMGRVVDANSPGIGANTLYDGREFYATTNIPPGRELFLE